jgi:acetyl-CoA synthetase
VVEAAVVGIPDDIFVTAPFMFLVISPGSEAGTVSQIITELIHSLKARLELHLAASDVPIHYLVKISFFSLKPDASIRKIFSKVVDRLPKTRTGKIIRRVLCKIALKQYDDLGDLNSLEDVTCIPSIIQAHKDKLQNS